jgi:hypothetical protein
MMQSTLPTLAISALPSVFVPEHAPVAAIGLLAAAGAVLAALLAAAVSLAARRGSLALRGLTAALAYAGLLAGCALTSSERVLPPGGRKYFCELDCHLALLARGRRARRRCRRGAVRRFRARTLHDRSRAHLVRPVEHRLVSRERPVDSESEGSLARRRRGPEDAPVRRHHARIRGVGGEFLSVFAASLARRILRDGPRFRRARGGPARPALRRRSARRRMRPPRAREQPAPREGLVRASGMTARRSCLSAARAARIGA